MNLPEQIVFVATLLKINMENISGLEDNEKEVKPATTFKVIWNTKPRLPKDFWRMLYDRGLAKSLTISVECLYCHSVLDKKLHWTFDIENTKKFLFKLGYELKKKKEDYLLFQLVPRNSDSDLSFRAQGYGLDFDCHVRHASVRKNRSSMNVKKVEVS